MSLLSFIVAKPDVAASEIYAAIDREMTIVSSLFPTIAFTRQPTVPYHIDFHVGRHSMMRENHER